MCSVDLIIDILRNRHNECAGSRIDLQDDVDGYSNLQVLASVVRQYASKRNKGLLVLPVSEEACITTALNSLATLPTELRASVYLEARASRGGLEPQTVQLLRRAAHRSNVALSTAGFDEASFFSAMQQLGKVLSLVIVDEELTANMVRTRKRTFLLDVSEAASRLGARVAVSGDLSDGNLAWLLDAGASMTLGSRRAAKVLCTELANQRSARTLRPAGQSAGEATLARAGVSSMMALE